MIRRIIRYALPVTALLVSACSQEDEPTAGSVPMEFTATLNSGSQQTRVKESDDGDCVWSGGEKITVRVTQNGNSENIVCTLSDDGSSIKSYSRQLYWQSKNASVKAWYSNITWNEDDECSLADQSNGPAYILVAENNSATFGNEVELVFEHKLAKVRVIVTGEKATEVTEAKISNHINCTINDNDGTITPGQTGLIKMQKVKDTDTEKIFEANVLPKNSLPSDLISFSEDFKMTVRGITEFVAGKTYTITVDAIDPIKYINGHKAVLMRKADPDKNIQALYFADCNIGANSAEEAGLYFWWGDTEGHDGTDGFEFDYDNKENIITRAKTAEELKNSGILTDSGILTAEYDAAHKKWGDNWRMPTLDELNWLLDNCTKTWIYNQENNPIGLQFQSLQTGASIVFPLGGCVTYNYFYNKGKHGYIRCSSYVSPTKSDKITQSPALYFQNYGSTIEMRILTGDISSGYNIRPVINI